MYLESNIKSECCGCKVCASVCKKKAVSFEYDEEGFWYPKISGEKCVDCGACRKACPFSKDELLPLKDENQFYAAFSKDDEILEASTSGGAFTHISDYVLENGGVVFGHCYDEKLNVVCIMANSKEQRNLFRGSKYVQSDMGNIYAAIKEKTESGVAVLVSGTPCQIDAVKKYFNEKIPENLVLLEIICHGVPSPKIFQDYILLIEMKKGKKVTDFKFRRKDKGWITPLRMIFYTDGTSCGELLNADAFNNLFQGTDCILRPSCYSCRYAGNARIADLSIADFWGVEKEEPEMFNDNKGCSLVLVNTEKGRHFFDIVKKNMKIKNIPMSKCASRNLPLTGLPFPRINRKKFFEDYKKLGLEKSMKKHCFKLEKSFRMRIKRFVIRILGKNNVMKIKKILAYKASCERDCSTAGGVPKRNGGMKRERKCAKPSPK